MQYSTTKQLNEGIDVDKIDSSSMHSRQRTHSFKTARLLQYLPCAQSHTAPYSYLVYMIYFLTDTAEEVSHFTINIRSKKCLHKHCDWRLGLKTISWSLFYCCDKNTMIKASYKNWAYGSIGLDPMMVDWRHSGRNSWELTSQTISRRQGAHWEWHK